MSWLKYLTIHKQCDSWCLQQELVCSKLTSWHICDRISAIFSKLHLICVLLQKHIQQLNKTCIFLSIFQTLSVFMIPGIQAWFMVRVIYMWQNTKRINTYILNNKGFLKTDTLFLLLLLLFYKFPHMFAWQGIIK